MNAPPEGRELDALVAERVMGWTNLRWTPEGVPLGFDPVWGSVHSASLYSTNLADAWEVVERVVQRGASFNLSVSRDGLSIEAMFDFGRAFVVDGAPTAPLAICRAALAATDPAPHAPDQRSSERPSLPLLEKP